MRTVKILIEVQTPDIVHDIVVCELINKLLDVGLADLIDTIADENIDPDERAGLQEIASCEIGQPEVISD